MVKTKRPVKGRQHVIHTEVPCEQWISKKKEQKCTATNKLRALFGKSKPRNPLIEIQFSSQPIEIKQTKQTTLNKYFGKEHGDSHLYRDHSPTNQNRNDCSVNVETVKEDATPETDHELKCTETNGTRESLKCSGHDWEEEIYLKSPIDRKKDIRADENKMRQTADSELDVCRSKVFGALMRKEQFQEKNLIPNECKHDELCDIMCVQITRNRTKSGSKFFMGEFPDASVLNSPGSNEETACPDQMSLNHHTEKSSRCLSSREYSDPQADKRVNNKMSVCEAVEQFSVKLKKIRNEVIYGCRQLETKPGDSETQPLTFHVQESSCDQSRDCTTSCDQQVDGRQSHDWGGCIDNESCDLTFHITDEDLMANGDNLEDFEDSQLSELTFH